MRHKHADRNATVLGSDQVTVDKEHWEQARETFSAILLEMQRATTHKIDGKKLACIPDVMAGAIKQWCEDMLEFTFGESGPK